MTNYETDLEIVFDRHKQEGIMRVGTTYHGSSADSWTQWATVMHEGRSDKEILSLLEDAGFYFGPFNNVPDWAYDCSGRSFGYGARIKRGKKVAVVSAWRGVDV